VFLCNEATGELHDMPNAWAPTTPLLIQGVGQSAELIGDRPEQWSWGGVAAAA
jgi:hypothetical protein